MWVRLKTIYYTEVGGKLTTKRPGDWIEVHKSEAMMLVARGQAEIPNYTEQAESLLVTEHAGLVVVGGDALPDAMLDQIRKVEIDRTEATYVKLSAQARDFIDQLLVLVPSSRATANQARNHPWILSYGHKRDRASRIKSYEEFQRVDPNLE